MDKHENWGVYTLLIGEIAIRQEGDCITVIQLISQLEHYPLHTPTPLTDRVAKQLEEYLLGVRTTFDFPYLGAGTRFQQQVWAELCKIPYGETRSYKEVASALGMPKASRAVGGANNKNPLLIVVPCHRVIGANGELTGYAAGMEVKQMLLRLEQDTKKLG